MDVLFVCTANLCRSPAAAAMLRRELADGDPRVVVTSGGRGPSGLTPPRDMVTAAAPFGLDLASHRSTQATPAQVAGADLVLGLAREHVVDVLSLDLESWPRTFTLKEFVRRGELVGPWPSTKPFREWLDVVGSGRSPRGVLAAPADDDVVDPVGCSARVYRSVLEELEALTRRLARLLVGR